MSKDHLDIVFPALNFFWNTLDLRASGVLEVHSDGLKRLNAAKMSDFWAAIRATREHLCLHLISSKAILNLYKLVFFEEFFIHSNGSALEASEPNMDKFTLLFRSCEEEQTQILADVSFNWDNHERMYERLEDKFLKKYQCGVRSTIVAFAKDSLKCPANLQENVARFAELRRKDLDVDYMTAVNQAFNHMLKIKSKEIANDPDFQKAITQKSKLITVQQIHGPEMASIESLDSFQHEYAQQSKQNKPVFFRQLCDGQSLELTDGDKILATHIASKQEIVFTPIFKTLFSEHLGFPIFRLLEHQSQRSDSSSEFVLADYENLFITREIRRAQAALANFDIPNCDKTFSPTLEKQYGALGLGQLSPHALCVFICLCKSLKYAGAHSNLTNEEKFTFDLTADGLENQKIECGYGFDYTFLSNVFFNKCESKTWNFLVSWPEFFFHKAFFFCDDDLLSRIRFMNVLYQFIELRNEVHTVANNPSNMSVMPLNMLKMMHETALEIYRKFTTSFSETQQKEVIKDVNHLHKSTFISFMFPTPLSHFKASGELSEKQV